MAAASDVTDRAPLALHYCGRELVAYRGADGAARVLDAYCPHLGAHMGCGGRIEGNAIRCPFHAWLYDGDSGECIEVPYAARIPARARVKSYATMEWAGLLLAWFPGEEEDANARPRWIPELPACDEPDWTLHSMRQWRLRTHVQEIGENGLDVAHVGPVHGSPPVVISDLRTEGPMLRLDTAPADPESAGFSGTIRRTLWGLGLSMNEFLGEVQSRVIITRTPVDTETVEVRMVFVPRRYEDARFTGALGDAVAERVAAEFEGDIAIWEHKAYVDDPVLCDGDGPIHKLRRWARQFY